MQQRSRLQLKWAVGTQYFLYFGVLGVFLPYFNLYCYHLGFSGAQIGVVSATRSITMVAFSLIWSVLADRYSVRRPIYILCTFISTLLWSLYFTTTAFWPMLLITMVYGIFHAPIISFLEAFTMDVLGHEKQGYGRIRVWGSISFILVVVVLGRVLDLLSIDLILVLIFAGSILLSLMTFSVPRLTAVRQTFGQRDLRSFLQLPVIVFLGCSFLMLVSHGTYYGFFSIHLENLGYSKTFIGIAWALASTSEILVMVTSKRLFDRFSLEKVLIFSFVVAVLRWLMLYFVSSAPLILLSQCLHAVTYGTFHMASILYIDRLSPARLKTFGQAINNAVQYGLGLMIGFFLNGFLYHALGSFNLFFISAVIAAGGGLLFSFSRISNKEPNKPE